MANSSRSGRTARRLMLVSWVILLSCAWAELAAASPRSPPKGKAGKGKSPPLAKRPSKSPPPRRSNTRRPPPAEHTDSLSCPAGQVPASVRGSNHTSSEECVPCDRGYYYSNSTSKCRSCPAGTYSDKLGVFSCKTCNATQGFVLVCKKGQKGQGNTCKPGGAVGCARVVPKSPPSPSGNHTRPSPSPSHGNGTSPSPRPRKSPPPRKGIPGRRVPPPRRSGNGTVSGRRPPPLAKGRSPPKASGTKGRSPPVRSRTAKPPPASEHTGRPSSPRRAAPPPRSSSMPPPGEAKPPAKYRQRPPVAGGGEPPPAIKLE